MYFDNCTPLKALFYSPSGEIIPVHLNSVHAFQTVEEADLRVYVTGKIVSEKEKKAFTTYLGPLVIEKVIFNPPATIVYWKDGTRTIVKCSANDTFDKEKGLAMCYMKKALGNDSERFHRIFRKEIDDAG